MQKQNTNKQIQCIHKYPKQPPKVYCTPTYNYMYYRWVLDLIPLGYSNEGRSVSSEVYYSRSEQLRLFFSSSFPPALLRIPKVYWGPTYNYRYHTCVLDLIPLGYSNEGRSVSSEVYYTWSEQLPKYIGSQLTNMCLPLSPLVTLPKGEVYRAKCFNLGVNNPPK